MPHAPRPRRTRSTLSQALQKRLNTYAIAAGAAGVTLLALAQPSEAEVVYTPANETIGRQGSYKLDLNHDGIIDYIIAEHAAPYGTLESFQELSARAAAGNQANCPSSFCISGNTYAAALTFGTPIGDSQRRGWLGKNVPMAEEDLNRDGSVFYYGGFTNVKDRYLGLRFLINGETHFGWARFSVIFKKGGPKDRTWIAELSGYAYETIPNKPIKAGQTTESTDEADLSFQKNLKPASSAPLAALALGANGIDLWRREVADEGHSGDF